MNNIKLESAIKEAERFLQKARTAKTKQDDDWGVDSERLHLNNRNLYENVSKENAACKRASMDLTRALSELRKP